MIFKITGSCGSMTWWIKLIDDLIRTFSLFAEYMYNYLLYFVEYIYKILVAIHSDNEILNDVAENKNQWSTIPARPKGIFLSTMRDACMHPPVLCPFSLLHVMNRCRSIPYAGGPDRPACTGRRRRMDKTSHREQRWKLVCP
jgi:hypothetical protein